MDLIAAICMDRLDRKSVCIRSTKAPLNFEDYDVSPQDLGGLGVG